MKLRKISILFLVALVFIGIQGCDLLGSLLSNSTVMVDAMVVQMPAPISTTTATIIITDNGADVTNATVSIGSTNIPHTSGNTYTGFIGNISAGNPVTLIVTGTSPNINISKTINMPTAPNITVPILGHSYDYLQPIPVSWDADTTVGSFTLVVPGTYTISTANYTDSVLSNLNTDPIPGSTLFQNLTNAFLYVSADRSSLISGYALGSILLVSNTAMSNTFDTH